MSKSPKSERYLIERFPNLLLTCIADLWYTDYNKNIPKIYTEKRRNRMKTVMIRLSTIQDVNRFVKIVSASENEIDLKSGRYVVDGKSIMGIFSLDLLSPIEMTVHGDNTEVLLAEIADFICK